MKSGKRKAWTLVESLVVLAIFGIILAIGIPLISGHLGSKYVVTDNVTKQQWVSRGYPTVLSGGNVNFTTVDGTGVIIHGSVSIKRVP